jgi:hypothetical protein
VTFVEARLAALAVTLVGLGLVLFVAWFLVGLVTGDVEVHFGTPAQAGGGVLYGLLFGRVFVGVVRCAR